MPAAALLLGCSMPLAFLGPRMGQEKGLIVEEFSLQAAAALPGRDPGSLSWVLDWRAPQAGELHAWVAEPQAQGHLLARGPDGQLLTLAASSPRRTTCLQLEVGAEQGLELVVELPADAAPARLRLVLCPETEETLEAAKALLSALAESRQLARAGEEERGRAVLLDAVDAARRVSGGASSARVNRALVETLQRLGVSGELALAEEVAEAALGHLQVAYPEDHAVHIEALHVLGTTLSSSRQLDRALEVQERAFELVSRVCEPHEEPWLDEAQALAITLGRRKEPLQARRLFERVFEERQRSYPGDVVGLINARINLAVVMAQLGDAWGAMDLFEQALEAQLELVSPDHPFVQVTRYNIANVLRNLGQNEQALEIMEEVVRVRERSLTPDHPRLLDSLTALAGLHLDLGQPQHAREIYRQVLASREESLPPDHFDLLATREELALVLLYDGEEEEASVLMRNVLEGRKRALPDEDPNLQRARRNMAAVLAVVGDRQGTVEQMRELGQALCALPALMTGRLSPRELELNVLRAEDDLSALLSIAGGLGVIEPAPELDILGFEAVEQLRAAALRAHALTRLLGDEGLAADLAEPVREASEDLTRLALAGAPPGDLAQARMRLDAAERNRIERLAQDARAATLLAPLRLETVSAALDGDEAVVAYRTYLRSQLLPGAPVRSTESSHMLAFVVRKGGRLERIDLGPTAQVREAVEAWRAALNVDPLRGLAVPDEPPEDRVLRAGRRVYQLVFAPLAPALEGVRRLIVVPDAELHSIPLDALPERDGLLGERLHLETRLALWSLDAGQPSEPTEGTLVVLGGVSYNAIPEPAASSSGTNVQEGEAPDAADSDSTGDLRGSSWERSFSPLPGTLGEAEAIVALWAESGRVQNAPIRLFGREATRQRLEASAPRARWLHLATHGWFEPDSVRSFADPAPLDTSLSALQRSSREQIVVGTSPMVLCGLALAGANRAPDERNRIGGVLTAAEIATWDLRGCELVVLSACDTNVGVSRAGQGVASLQTALHMAGARRVITSLWKVPDQATQELMADLYRRLWIEGKSVGRALWESKMRLRAVREPGGRPRYAPRDWAGWVLTGSTD